MKRALLTIAAIVIAGSASAETKLPECDAHGMAPGLLSKPGVSKVCRMHFPNGTTTLCGGLYPAGGITCIIERSSTGLYMHSRLCT
jgi:hypothetical protein